jgi:hypothetical protein
MLPLRTIAILWKVSFVRQDGKTNVTPKNSSTFVWMTAGIGYTGNTIVRMGTVIFIR